MFVLYLPLSFVLEYKHQSVCDFPHYKCVYQIRVCSYLSVINHPFISFYIYEAETLTKHERKIRKRENGKMRMTISEGVRAIIFLVVSAILTGRVQRAKYARSKTICLRQSFFVVCDSKIWKLIKKFIKKLIKKCLSVLCE